MTKSKVAVITCSSYNVDEVSAAVKRGLGLIGGADAFIKSGEKILVKPNMLVGDPAEKGTTTHPAVFRAVCAELMNAGAVLSYGDSPAFGSPASVAKKCGIAAAADEINIPLADFETKVDIVFHEGVQNKKFTVAKAVTECDGLVSLPRLKTHGLTRFTGCVKNQFGCVPGFLKAEYHVKMQDASAFSKMLVDLNNYVKPRLYVMDGVTAMEGNGPRGGKLKNLGVILISADPIALDATACRIVGMDPLFVPTTVYGYESGMGTYREDEIEICGDPIQNFIDNRFDIKRKPVKPYTKKGGITGFINNLIVPKPVITSSECVKCGICVTACPADPKAVNWFDGDKTKPPSYRYGDCIRCYCCQELCPEGAVKLKTGFIRGLFSRKK